MLLNYTLGFYGNILWEIFLEVQNYAFNKPWRIRLWVVPLALLLALTLPVVKIFSCLELLLGVFKNKGKGLLGFLISFFDVLVSPLKSIILGCMVFGALFSDPVSASAKFAWHYFHHPSTWKVAKSIEHWRLKRLNYLEKEYTKLSKEHSNNHRLYYRWAEALKALGEEKQGSKMLRYAEKLEKSKL